MIAIGHASRKPWLANALSIFRLGSVCAKLSAHTRSAVSYLNACEVTETRSSGSGTTSYIQEFISTISESGNRAGHSNSSLREP